VVGILAGKYGVEKSSIQFSIVGDVANWPGLEFRSLVSGASLETIGVRDSEGRYRTTIINAVDSSRAHRSFHNLDGLDRDGISKTPALAVCHLPR
jgi:hypothetical protein